MSSIFFKVTCLLNDHNWKFSLLVLLILERLRPHLLFLSFMLQCSSLLVPIQVQVTVLSCSDSQITRFKLTGHTRVTVFLSI